MNLARADTYINVYLPRPDGEDPRRYAQITSPVFGEEKPYRFSDQIQKDRPLFLGKKQMSLYEIYYKDSKGYVSLEKASHDDDLDERDEHEDEEISEHSMNHDQEKGVELPSLKKVSLSLDYKIKQRYRRPSMTRFNEPLNAYVSNKKKVQSLTRFDPNSNLERQVSTYDFSHQRKEGTYYENVYKPTDTISIPRLYKKSLSAPSDVRQIRSLGLPPIMISNIRRSTRVPAVVLPIKQPEDSIRVLPVRPSSKPHKVWRQTTDILTDRYTAKFSRIPKMRILAQQPVDLAVTSNSVFKSR